MKQLKTLFSFLLFLGFVSGVMAQSKELSKANKLYKMQNYAEAIPLFEKSLEEKSSLVVQTKLAYAYKVTNQTDKAEKLYADIVYADRPRPITFFYYGEALMSNGKYAAAKFWFEEYLKKTPNDPKSLQLIEACDKVNFIKPYFGYLDVKPFAYNSASDDNAPVFWKDQIVFCSDRKQGAKLLKQKSGWTGRDFINIYQAQKQADGTFSEPEPFVSKINGLNKNTGPISFSADGNKAVFSRNSDIANKQDAFAMQLYQAEYSEDGKWKNIEVIDFCNPEFNYMHPALSPDGNRLFFTSDRSGGKGGTELYLSEKKADGTWDKPVSLGDVVNTDDHEGFPFCDAEGRLFFSSKGHLGFGGFDVFYTQQDEQGNWMKPVNVGFPVNSSSDDISIWLAADGQSGMFTSGRGKAGDDVYLFNVTNTPALTDSDQMVASQADAQTIKANSEEAAKPKPEEISSNPIAINQSPSKSSKTLVTEPEEDFFNPELETIKEIPEPEITLTEMAPPETLPETIDPMNNREAPKNPEPSVVIEGSPANEIVAVPEPNAVLDAEEIPAPEMETSLTEIFTETAKGVEEMPESTEIVAPETKVLQEEFFNETPVITQEEILLSEAPVVPEVPQMEIIEPERVVEEPIMLEQVLEIDQNDQAITVVIPAKNTLSELKNDLMASTLSVDKSYQIAQVDYDFNQIAVTPALAANLDELALILKNNPQIEVQLIGHTASFGNNLKNQELSVARALAASEYLQQKGIERHRLTATGMGESQLLNECVDGILCSMAQHKVNERLEVKVMRY